MIGRGTRTARDLGKRIRDLRDRRDLTGQELAERAGLAQGTLSKIEQGRVLPSIDLLCRLGATLQVPTPELEEWLVETQLIPVGTGLPYEFLRSSDVERFQIMLEAIERKCLRLRMYQSQIIPGQLQTEGYAAAIIGLVRDLSPDALERAIQARLRRRAILESKQCDFVLTEDALRARVAPASVLVPQIEELQRIAMRPNVRLAVIPWSARLTGHRPPSFYIYDDNLVHVEVPHDHVRLTRRQDVTLYEALFATQLHMAEAGPEATAILERIKQDHLRLEQLETSAHTTLLSNGDLPARDPARGKRG